MSSCNQSFRFKKWHKTTTISIKKKLFYNKFKIIFTSWNIHYLWMYNKRVKSLVILCSFLLLVFHCNFLLDIRNKMSRLALGGLERVFVWMKITVVNLLLTDCMTEELNWKFLYTKFKKFVHFPSIYIRNIFYSI